MVDVIGNERGKNRGKNINEENMSEGGDEVLDWKC